MEVKEIIKQINKIAKELGKNINLMEACGTHTQVISRYGIRDILPKNIKLITGPGCPVCVTAQRDIDAIINLALAGVPVATYGDLMRVPGYFGSLDEAREKGARVFDVYSVTDALKLKDEYTDLVFFGLGFETTTPMTAWAIKNKLTVYCAHKIFLPAMKALMRSKEISIDGFIDPGHVSVVIGIAPYDELKIPQVITGFEMKDVLVGILILLNKIKNKDTKVVNQYSRVVKNEGNKKIREMIEDVFETTDGDWRGFGIIPASGLKIKDKYREFDAKIKYKDILDKVDFSHSKDPAGCKCGDVIRGIIDSKKCLLFGKICTPDNPIGPCMVSVEGACNVTFRYDK